MKWVGNIRFGKKKWNTPFGKSELNKLLLNYTIGNLNQFRKYSGKFAGVREISLGKIKHRLNALIGV